MPDAEFLQKLSSIQKVKKKNPKYWSLRQWSEAGAAGNFIMFIVKKDGEATAALVANLFFKYLRVQQNLGSRIQNYSMRIRKYW